MTKHKDLVQFRQQLFTLIEQTKGSIFITSHMKPDYDSVCSSIALLRILRTQFPDKQIQILFSEIWIEEWDDLYEEGDIVWIDEKNKQRRSPDEQPYNMFQYLNPSDMVIGIDGNSYDRFVPADSKYIREKLPFFQSITTALIDHHQGEADKATLTYINPEATSTCEIIATMFDEEMITKEIAMMLLWGILTDTGFFDFVRVHNVDVFDTVKMLFLKTERKSMEEVKQRFKTDEETFDYLQVLHMNRQKVTSEENGIPMSIYSWINTHQYTDETKRELAAGKSMFFSQLKRLERYSLYWIIAPTTKPHQYSIAFRSKEGIDVATLASDHFNGGGHTNAAGGRYALTADEKTDLEKRRTAEPTFADGQYVSERVLKILTNEVRWEKYKV